MKNNKEIKNKMAVAKGRCVHTMNAEDSETKTFDF